VLRWFFSFCPLGKRAKICLAGVSKPRPETSDRTTLTITLEQEYQTLDIQNLICSLSIAIHKCTRGSGAADWACGLVTWRVAGWASCVRAVMLGLDWLGDVVFGVII
jgi:hypothetical protein